MRRSDESKENLLDQKAGDRWYSRSSLGSTTKKLPIPLKQTNFKFIFSNRLIYPFMGSLTFTSDKNYEGKAEISPELTKVFFVVSNYLRSTLGAFYHTLKHADRLFFNFHLNATFPTEIFSH